MAVSAHLCARRGPSHPYDVPFERRSDLPEGGAIRRVPPPRSGTASPGGDLRPHLAVGSPLAGRALLQLQRAAGNGATAGLVGNRIRIQRAGPEPQAFSPPDGLLELRGGGVAAGTPMGETDARASPPPFAVTGGRVEGGYEGRVRPAPPAETTITPRYPAPGVYNFPPSGDRPRRAIITDGVSQEAKVGEQEHSDDYWHANRMVYGRVVESINQLAGQPARRGTDVRDVHRQWRVALRDTLPAQLREDPEQVSPTAPWTAAYGHLRGASLRRDSERRHSFGSRSATAEERAAEEVPEGTDAIVVTGQVRRLDPQGLMDTAWGELRERP